MFYVVVSFLTEVDEYGIVRKGYEFSDEQEANEYYQTLLNRYSSSIEEGLVSIGIDI